MLTFMHACVCFCTLAQTFPLFQCLSAALSAPNTTSLLSIVSLPDRPYHQEWPFPPTSLFFSRPLSSEGKSSSLQSFRAAQWGGCRLWHCRPRSIASFSLSIMITLLFSDQPFTLTKCVSSMNRGFFITGDIYRADFKEIWGPDLTAEPFKSSLWCDHGRLQTFHFSPKSTRNHGDLCDCDYDNHACLWFVPLSV